MEKNETKNHKSNRMNNLGEEEKVPAAVTVHCLLQTFFSLFLFGGDRWRGNEWNQRQTSRKSFRFVLFYVLERRRKIAVESFWLAKRNQIMQ